MNLSQNTNVLMKANDLAKFLFIENYNNIKLTITSNEFKNAKDTFFFLLDLFFKGLVLLFGKKINDMSMRVVLNELDISQIDIVKDKFKSAYIKLHCDFFHYSLYKDGNPEYIKTFSQGNISDINNMSDNLNISNYKFILSLDEIIYVIYFELLYDID